MLCINEWNDVHFGIYACLIISKGPPPARPFLEQLSKHV
jgi:hypothetical protein